MNTDKPHTDHPSQDEIPIGLPNGDGTDHVEQPDPSHRDNSMFKKLIESSSIDVVNCSQSDFVRHVFGADVESVVVADDPNDFELRWTSNHDGTWKYFCPIPLSKVHANGPYGNRITQFDLPHGQFEYAAFEVSSGELPEQFTLEVQTEGYPAVAVISVDALTVHMLCHVGAGNVEHYRDRCELILRMAHDIVGCGREAKQITFCSMPQIQKGNLLFLDPKVKWRLPVPTKDFA